MTSSHIVRRAAAAAVALMLAGLPVATEGQLLPSGPKKAFGASVSPAYDGWYDNADGTRTFLMGYYSRNWTDEIDVPIGPNNHFEPGEPDRGQPTYFRPNRNFGMFTVTVPKGATEKLWWVITVNGVTQRVPLSSTPDYNITPQTASEESPGGKYNKPAVLRFSATGPAIQNPEATVAKAIARVATVGIPMTLDVWVEDDALYSSGSNAPIGEHEKIVDLVVAKYRGPGKVTVGTGHDKWTIVKGGKPAEPFAGTTSTTATFSEPGEYLLHVTLNDLSGPGGGNTGCCWTTSLVKVSVKPAAGGPPTGGR